MKTKITIEKNFELASVSGKLFSSFVEHLGRAVYTGIYEPEHPLADEQGFRSDVIEMVRELHVPLVRYPGGNFLSSYDWKDGIGPRGKRPARTDIAWHSIEPNTIGIDEFYDWTQKAGTSIMGAVNMGTGTPRDAAELVEYCNHPGGTYWSDLRRTNGHENPYGIKTWCVGNEMDGPWQTCHLEAAEYGKKARETARFMKGIDNTIECVVCGSSTTSLPTYPEWDRIVLEYTYDAADYISIHRYYENFGDDDDFLASFCDMNDFIKTACATADYVKALKRSKKTMYLSFDEWNVWYQQNMQEHPWLTAPRILEDHYSLLDALVLGGLAITLLNHADRIKIACLAQLINVIAPIFTEPGKGAYRQTIYWPYHDISVYGHGTVLHPVICAPKEVTKKYGEVPAVIFAVVHNAESGEVTVFALNINRKEISETEINLASFGKTTMFFRTEMTGQNLSVKNSFDNPDAVMSRPAEQVQSENGMYNVVLKAASWNVLRFKIEK
jgi:alpha-L-arabinofuranosidase